MSETCRAWTVPDETYTVIVRIPIPLRTRIAETWNNCKTRIAATWNNCKSYWTCTFCTFFYLSVCFLAYGLVFVVISCHKEPGMGLESLSIRDMAVYQNATSAAWQVDSAFDVTLSTWNPNTVAGCFTTYRRVVVRVEYKSQTILQQEVPLGFGLKPRRSRPVSMQLQGLEVQLQKPDRGPVLEAELRGGNVTLDVYFDARYLRNDRKAGWVSLDCLLVATTPSNSSASSLLNKLCYST